MSEHIIVVENLKDWRGIAGDYPLVHVDDYLTGAEFAKRKDLRVINLCRGYQYLSTGYYCSLLAEARKHKVLPSVRTMLELSSRRLYGLDVVELDALAHKLLGRRRLSEERYALDVHFGHCSDPGLEDLARQLFTTFPCPLLQVEFERSDGWHIKRVKPLPLQRLDDTQRVTLGEALGKHLQKRWRSAKARRNPRFDLAILHDPEEKLAPSNKRALRKFVEAGKDLGVDVDLITRKDYTRLAEYDALFIRTTTQINHYTYRFAKKARSEGMVVIDDPDSILRCTNKVYLAELLRNARVATPRSLIVGRRELPLVGPQLGFPVVVKIPEGSFSRGVFKAANEQELAEIAARLFQESELILAQEYMYTEFDWRVGVLNRKPLYVSQYFMSRDHWQIVKHEANGKYEEGRFKTMAVEEAPPKVIATAVKAANLIGDGLYGVDLKQGGDKIVVIEVNDNPNLDAGVEDASLKDELYTQIIGEFVRRLEAQLKT